MFEPSSKPPVCLHMLDQPLVDKLWSYGCRMRSAMEKLLYTKGEDAKIARHVAHSLLNEIDKEGGSL